MISLRLFTSARAICAGSVIIGIVGLAACKVEKAPPPAEQAKSPALATVPESSQETFAAYLASHLPPGKKHGDFLTDKRDYPSGDTADVYRAVLDTLYQTKDGSPGEVVLADVAYTRGVYCTKMPCPLLPLIQREIRVETLEAYRSATLTRRHMRRFKYRLPIRLVSEDDIRALEVDGIKIASSAGTDQPSNRQHPMWIGFRAKYPRAWGLTRLSSVGIDPQKKEALVEVTHLCGTSCTSTEVMYLWKVRGRWTVIERIPEATDFSASAGGSLVYRGPDAEESEPGRVARQHAARRADSIKQESQPREIYGVLLMNPGGGALRDYVVSLRYGDDYNLQRARVTSDSVGVYRFERPPIGEVGIIVHCPRSSARPDGPAAIGTAVVQPGKKLNYNMSFDPRTCDDSLGTPTGVQAYYEVPPMGSPFDTAAWRTGRYPNDEEAGVYKRIFQGLSSPYGNAIALVYYKTRSPCTDADCPRKYNERVRYIPEVMQSTLDDFQRVRVQQIVFRPEILPNASYHMVGDSTLTGLERAMGHRDMIYDWGHVHMAWPSVQMLYSFGPVAFSPHHQQALVEVTKSSVDGLEKQMWVLRKESSGEWALERTFE